MTQSERKERLRAYLGKKVNIQIDRPIGYVHQTEAYSRTYPINYGFLPGVFGGDGEEQDAYLVGVDEPVSSYTGIVIGIVHRRDDVEDKLVVAPPGKVFYQHEIAAAVHFTEQYYETYVECIFEKSCGAVVYTEIEGERRYLLIRAGRTGINCGFPKGHMEIGETEEATALREVWEETSVRAELCPGFKEDSTYTMPNGHVKNVTYFLAAYKNQTPHHNSGYEHNDYLLLPYEPALATLSYPAAKAILRKAEAFLSSPV